MKKGFRVVFAAICGLAVIGAANAQDQGNWYAAAGGSLTLRDAVDGTIANAPAPGLTVRTGNPIEPGFGGHVAVGRRLGNFRLEGELSYTRETQNRYEAIVPPTGQIFADVTEERMRAMINGYVDFNTGRVQPYLGVGAGYASTDLLTIAPRAPFPTEQPLRLIDDSDKGFAWQAMAGFATPLNEALDLTVQYRWFDGGTFEAVDSRRENVTRDIRGHSFDVGLRLNF